MNVAFEYVYRDGTNCKFSGRAVFAGPLTPELLARLKSALDEGQYFVAEAVGVPTTYATQHGYEHIPGVDHQWHEWRGVSATREAPTDPRSFAALVEGFEGASARSWLPPERDQDHGRRVNGVERTTAEDRLEVLAGADDLDGSRAQEMMRTVNEPRGRAPRAHFTIETKPGFVLLEDQGTGTTITNDAAGVIAQLDRWGSLKDGARVLYRDSSGQWDELRHKAGQFDGFAPIGARTPAAAMATLRERETIAIRLDGSVFLPGPVSRRVEDVARAVAEEAKAMFLLEGRGAAILCPNPATTAFAAKRLAAELDYGIARVERTAAREVTARRQSRKRADPFTR